MPERVQTTHVTERQTERRVPRVPFKATSVITEADASGIVVAQTSELSPLGCFVQTLKPYPKGTRVHIEIADAGITFVASGVVAYVTAEGMAVVFSTVEPADQKILENWLSRTPRQSDRHSFVARVQVNELGSWGQGLITRDLSAGGCFIKTAVPLPKGTRIRVRIEHAGAEFAAIGRVTDNLNAEGLGVEFIEIEPSDRATLEKWLADGKVR